MKNLKKVWVIVFLMNCLSVFSQSIFDKYEEKEGVKSMVISQKMFDIFSKIQANDKESQDFMRIAKSLSGLKIFTTEEAKISQQIKTDLIQYLKLEKLQQVTRVKDKNTNAKFYIKEGISDDYISELLMTIEDNSTFLVLILTGNIRLNDIKLLAKKMDLPKELENF